MTARIPPDDELEAMLVVHDGPCRHALSECMNDVRTLVAAVRSLRGLAEDVVADWRSMSSDFDVSMEALEAAVGDGSEPEPVE